MTRVSILYPINQLIKLSHKSIIKQALRLARSRAAAHSVAGARAAVALRVVFVATAEELGFAVVAGGGLLGRCCLPWQG
jgi:hypothetical protein